MVASMAPMTTAPSRPAPRASLRPLVLVALVCIAPVVASYLAYYVFHRDSRVNYGTLIARPAPPFAATALDGKPLSLDDFKGRWLLLTAAPAACAAACTTALFATRQARTIQGRERDRVARAWLVTDDAPVAESLRAEHPDLDIGRVPAAVMAAWPRGADAIYLVDPLGNVVLAWPREPDIKALANDLTRLLRASQIG
jgi:hypothetical protein